MNDLLPCPFCHGEAFRDSSADCTGTPMVGCMDCSAHVVARTQVEADAAWNRRALPAASQPEALPVAWRYWHEAPKGFENQSCWRYISPEDQAVMEIEEAVPLYTRPAHSPLLDALVEKAARHFEDQADNIESRLNGPGYANVPVAEVRQTIADLRRDGRAMRKVLADAIAETTAHPTRAPVVPAEGLVATEAMVDAAFAALPPDACGTIGSGEMYRVLEAALRAQQRAAPELHRSFPDAADGRAMPPMGDDLMTAGLNAEDARFVAIQLAKNGLALVPAPAPVSGVTVQEAAVVVADAIDADPRAYNKLMVDFTAHPDWPAKHFFSRALRHYAAALSDPVLGE